MRLGEVEQLVKIRELGVAGPGPPGVCLTVLITSGGKTFRETSWDGDWDLRNKTGTRANNLISGASTNMLRLLPLPGSLWNLGSGLGSWCQEISGCPLTLQSDQPSGRQRRHCQITAKSRQRTQAEKMFLNHKSLFSRTHEWVLLQSWVSPMLFLSVWLMMGQRLLGVGDIPNFSIWLTVSNNTTSRLLRMCSEPGTGLSILCYLTLSWNRRFLPTWLFLWSRSYHISILQTQKPCL